MISYGPHLEAREKKYLRKVNVYELWVNVKGYYNMLSKSESTGQIFLGVRGTVVLVSCLCG